jgi:small neutral amino acid transporter SnatA (MarC family)
MCFALSGDDHCIHGIRHAKRATYGCSSSEAAVRTPDSLPLAAIAAAVIGVGVTFAVLLFAIQLGSHSGKRTQVIVTRFKGLIVASMGIQFMLVGLKVFFHT